MKNKIVMVEDFLELRFRTAFRQYFEELQIQVADWEGLFREMNNDPNGKNYAYVMLSEQDEAIGFLQFTVLELKSWFFETKVGFIREFWVEPMHRGCGCGSELLRRAEAYFAENGLPIVLLTTDTAARFYEKHGYHQAPGITAINHDMVFVKRLSDVQR